MLTSQCQKFVTETSTSVADNYFEVIVFALSVSLAESRLSFGRSGNSIVASLILLSSFVLSHSFLTSSSQKVFEQTLE
jgi:hypothetical protein